MNILWIHRFRLLGSLLLVAFLQRLMPWARAEEPTWFKLNGIPEASVGLEVDGSTETTHVGAGDSTYDTLFITPTVGLKTSGSIYHPNLLAFDLDGELGWGWNRMATSGPGFRQTINESDELNRYLVQVNVLQAKPYNASFFAAEDHSYRDYGSFDTFTVDSERYGGRINWNTEHLSINSDFGYRDEKASGLTSSSELAELYFNFVGLDRRQSGQTTLTASVNQFDNTLNFGNQVTSLNETVGLSDSETFGSRKQITAATGVSYSQSEYSGQRMETVTASENISVNHRPKLDSYFVMDFSHDQLQSEEDTRLQGVYGIRHQLYESLTSNLDAHGNLQENSGFNNSGNSDRYGLGLFESYTKRLQSWGRLSAGAGIIADHQDDQTTGGSVTTFNEAHQLYVPPHYRPEYLARPRVIASTIQVSVGGDTLGEGTDYEVIRSGELTEIRLIPTSSHVLILLVGGDSLAVAVTYQSASINNDAYESLNASSQIRLDLFGAFGIYGRMNWMDNNAPATVLTQTLTDLVGGVDYHWRWLRTGAEYEDYDSNFSRYQAWRFFQSCDFRLDQRSSLSLNLNETFYHYPGNGDQTQYQFLTRYNLQLWSSLGWYVEGGCSTQDVLGTDQVQGSARTGLNWSRGKLSIRTGYEYNTQSTSSGAFTEERTKHRLFAYIKRTF